MAGRKAKENKLEITVPIIKCPKCSGNCNSSSLLMECEKCKETYPVDFSILTTEFSKFVMIENEIISRYMEFLLSQKETFEIENKKSEDVRDSFIVTYKGEALEAFRRLKQDYNFKTLLLVVKFITEGFFNILSIMRSMPGDKFYLIDNLGNKSPELQKDMLRTAYNSFYREKDKELVSNFLKSMEINFRIDDFKKGEKGEPGEEQSIG